MGNVVIFDVDGTLADTKTGIILALNDTLKEAGLKKIIPEKEDLFIGPPIKKSLMDQLHLEENKAEMLTMRYRELYVSHCIEESVLYDGAIDVLQFLKEYDYIIGIATMKTKSQLDRLLDMFSLEKYFDIIKTASESGKVTKKDMLRDIRVKLDDGYRKMYMVGDTRGDWKAAMTNDYCFISADYGYGDMQNIEGSHISRLNDMITLMKENYS